MTDSRTTRTQVAIVGGGPAGLMLSHLLHLAGIESVVVDHRTVEQIETTHRAGILEAGSVRLLDESGASDRVLKDGHEHEGIALRFNGVSHRIDFHKLVGASVWLYPQTAVFADLYRTRSRAGADLRYGITGTTIDSVSGGVTDRPKVRYEADGSAYEIQADLVIGCDGSRSICRELVADRNQYFREYPYAWFGVLVEAPPSAPELIYTRSPRGFALISQRTEDVQRMYFQCEPDEQPEDWSDDRIWAELHSRLSGEDGFQLKEGPVIERTVLPFRSFVQSPMRHGRLLLAGDAAHTVPPTGAKGLNLALADARVLADLVVDALARQDLDVLASYTPRALDRVWKAQHFSYWMTTMLHREATGSDFDERRQLGELSWLVSSPAGSAYLAEGYTGWPDERHR